MNKERKTPSRVSRFKSPLNLLTSFKDPKLSEVENIEPLDNSDDRISPQTVRSDIGSYDASKEFSFAKDFDFKKSFQKLSQFKFDNLFQGNLKDKEELRNSARFKLKRSRCLSSNRYGPTKKIFDIEEKLKQINSYFKNEFQQKKELFNNIPRELKEGAQEKLQLFLRKNQERIRAIRYRSSATDNSSDAFEESKIEETFMQERTGRNRSTTHILSNNNIITFDSESQERNSIQIKRESIFKRHRHHQIEGEDIEPEGNNLGLETRNLSDTENRQTEVSIGNVIENREDENVNIATENSNGNIFNNENRNNTNINEEVNQGNGIDNLNDIVEREANFRLRRALVIFLSVFISSFCLSLMLENGFSHRALFICIYGFFAYYFIEGFKRIISPEVINWKRVENIFNLVDIASVIFSVIIIDLKISGMIEKTNFTFIMPLASSSLYYFSSKAPKSVLESQTVTRILFTLQIFLLTSRIDGSILWPWKSTICLMWIYLGMMVLYFILLAFMMVLMLVLVVFKINLYQNMDAKTQIVGFMWYLSYIGLGPLHFAALIGLCDAYDEKRDFTILKECITIAQYYTVIAIIFTRLTYRTLIVFLQKFNIDEPEFRIQIGTRDSGNLNKIEVEKKNIYLVMLSSTYFLPLKQSFFMKSKQNLKRCKQALLDSKNRIFKKGYFKKLSLNRKRGKSEEPISIEALRKDKEELNKKFEQGNRIVLTSKKSQRKGLPREQSFHLLDFPKDWETIKFDDIEKNFISLKYKGMCFSEGDKDYIQNWAAFDFDDHKHAENENLCYICFEKVANAVIMPCGHGGICFDCALQFVKGKNQCMECRGAIENVVKINPNPQMRNIIKGYETTKLIGGAQHENEENYIS